MAPILAAAERLQRIGCPAIAAEWGYFAYFQQEVAAHVSVPVFMSSLLQFENLWAADRRPTSPTSNYARAVQREVARPVFTWSTVMDYAYSVVAHRDHYGHV